MPVIRCFPVLLILKVLFAIAFCQSNDIDVRLIDYNNYKYCVAAGRDLQSIMMWDNNPTESYIEPNLENLRINCKFKVNEECTQYWRGGDWVVKNSLELLLGPLLDRRWEGVPSYDGREYSGRIDFTNKHDFSIQNGNNFEIPVSFKSNRDLHIFLCDGNNELYSNCYWIIIAGWGGTETGIRKCKRNQIPAKNNVFDYPPECKITQKNMTHGIILSQDKWNHIFVKKNERKISVNVQDGRALLEWTDEDEEINVSQLIITLRSTGQFKVHEYNLIFTKEQSVKQMGKFDFGIGNTFCIAIFVNMCKKCKMILFLQNVDNGDTLEEKTFTTDGEWEEIYYSLNISAYENIQAYSFYIKTVAEGNAGNQFWAIGEVRACSSRDIRVIRIGNQDSKCVIIKSNKPNQRIVIDSKPPEKSNRMERCLDYSLKIGDICYPFNTNSNVGSRICYFDKEQKQSMCYCSPGSQGQDCNTDCKSSYGYDCEEKCGHCTHNICNKINGNCTYGCEGNFVSPTCKIGKYPVLKQLPKILEVNYFSIKLQLNSTNYEGQEEPVTYKFWYRPKKQYSVQWFQTDEFKWNDLSEKYIENLTPSTVYEIKTLLIANDNRFDGENTPTFEVITNCDDLTRGNIKIESKSNVSVKLIVEDKQQSCDLSLYEITMGSERVTFSNKMYSRDDLEPDKQYKISFKRNSMTFTFDFRTEEGIPGYVTDLKLDSQTPSSISIAWRAPTKPNGKIENYYIHYRLIRNIKCRKEISNSAIVTQTSSSTFYTIENLKPYSVYEVGVSAKTSAGEGKTVMRRFNTTPADNLLENEISEPNIKTNSNNADIIIKKDCFNSGGELYYHIQGYCSDSWCKPSKDLTYDNNKNIITNLIPFSNYTINISIYRQYYNKIISSMDRNFLTTASQPNKMTGVSDYSKTESSVSLRWKPSFPPNGIIEKFRITWWREYNNPTYLDVEPVRCKIWDDYYCYNLTNLNAMTTYKFTISGKNEMVNRYSSESAPIIVKTKTEFPEVPKNPRITFDDDNNIISSWLHPDKINGPLEEIIITLEDNTKSILYNARYTEDFEKLNFTKKINHPENGWNNDLASAAFKACNSFGCSDFARVKIKLPPQLPIFHGEVLTEATENSAKIILPKLTHYNNKYYLLITNVNQHSNIDDELLRKFKQKCDISPSENGWSVITENLKDSKITIGKDINDSDIKVSIKPNTNYEACIVLLNEKNNIQRFSAQKVKFTSTTPTQPEETTDTNYGLLALLLLLLLPAVAMWIYVRRKNKAPLLPFLAKTNEGSSPDVIPLSPKQAGKSIQPPALVEKPKMPKPSAKEHKGMFSKPIKLADFEQYVKEAIATGELQRQHNLFPRGQTKPWEYGILPANKSKNRYNNLIAYDHSRVILEKIHGDNYSDYINASYIKGFNDIPKAYIATQGPKISTVNDFWRMIWQEKVNHIVMLANVIENGKKKTEQYWPNINETKDFGRISVSFVSSQVYADYEYRQFIVQKDGIQRNVQQLHFTSWPDHGVPLYSQSLVPFLQKMLTIPQGNSAPIVVHCSAGVGRTGTIILSDICLRMAAREATVDVLWYLKQLRDQRANMVDNIEQYKLVHMILLECLFAPTTSMLCDNTFEAKVEKTCAEEIDGQMQYLKDTMWQDQMLRTMLGDDSSVVPEHPNKNRFKNIVPDKYGLIYITRYPLDDESSSYINAVQVDGFRVPNKFIATQQPLPNTICDFWRLVNDKESTVIVSLNEIKQDDKTCQIFWPTADNPEMYPVPFIRLEYVKSYDTEIYSTITINLHLEKNKETETRAIQFILFKTWNATSLLPDKHENLLTLCEEVERISRSGGPIIVTCYNGATACGLFTAANFLIEKIKLEQQCDVCLAVRVVRHNRVQFIKDKRQFSYLYELALKYISGFETYSNFA